MRVTDKSISEIDELVGDLKQARIIFIGELHDQEGHHKAQLEVIRVLHEAGLQLAVGLEMFLSDHQEDLDNWTSGRMALDDFIRSYYHNWEMPWPLYRDIFLYSRENGIPMIGLNVSPEIVSQVARRGFRSLSRDQLERLPGVKCQVDKIYEDFIRRAMGDRVHGSKSFRNFCEAQMVWDTTMANNLLVFLKENPATTVVVIAGSAHSWKRGIPAQVSRQSDLNYKVILPEIPERLERKTVTIDDADYLWLGITSIDH